MKDIIKQFPLVRAVDNVSFMIKAGEIHSLLGENGAGKTCLMKVLYGMLNSEKGTISINGKIVQIKNPKMAIDLGIGMVHQHFMLTPVMTVTENIIVNNEPLLKKGLFIDYARAKIQVQKLIDKYHFNIDANAYVKNLSVGEQQRVEILKAIYRGAKILILDEPTAVLTPQEVEELFLIMRQLKEDGTGIVIITHKLKETLEIADCISVLRDGKMIRHRETLKNVNENILAEMMVGREVELNIRADESNIGEPYFFVKNCNLEKDGRDVLTDINFEIRKGEILGIAGVDGNGQTELIEILTGLRKANFVEIIKDGIKIKGQSSDFLRAKIGHIPEDRLDRGLISHMTIEENFILGYHNLSEYVKHGFLNFKNSKQNTLKAIKEYKIKTPNEREFISSLSGGNQQKVVVARVVSQNPDVLIVAQPTRGVDVGAMEYIHRQILQLKKEGKAILLISADLEEVYDLSDRIAVIYNGKINYILDKNQTNQLELGLLMTGGTLND
jgi:simple sugar transport system ATP-binding protein